MCGMFMIKQSTWTTIVCIYLHMQPVHGVRIHINRSTVDSTILIHLKKKRLNMLFCIASTTASPHMGAK